jgi:radical SAM protein with 4Fe4S-binding SPASM domain
VNCPTYPELTLDSWGDELVQTLQGRRHPLGGTFELTERCNLACVHCLINQPAASRAAVARELSASRLGVLLDQVADAGCLFLLLTGGEVLLRPDFPEIYQHAKRRGMLVSLFTNGTLLTPRIADLLADSRPFVVEITLYGATEGTYERVTQVPGSYARCRRGIELALDRGLRLSLKAVLLTTNRHELPDMRVFADQLGVRFRYDGMLWPRLDGGEQPLAHRLSLQEMINLDRQDPERQRAWDESARSFGDQLVRAEYVYGCGAGFRSFHVDCSGQLSMCLMARRTAYNLLQGSFQEGWEYLGALRKEKRQMATECRTCTVGALCSQCPGWSQVVYGDNETPVGFVCELGRLRAAEAQRTHA